ncbi:MAG: sialate O-acetylesterase [Victivallaceae bacterium]|nr:sialate O-acetylesterase [Victivallaceae bacterium]
MKCRWGFAATIMLAAIMLGGCCKLCNKSDDLTVKSFDPSPLAKNFTVHANYSSHMVLQLGKPVRISGTADPDGWVMVSLASDGKPVEIDVLDGDVKLAANGKAEFISVVKTDKNGEWEAVFDQFVKIKGGSFTVTVSGAEGVKPIVFDDVVFGEVWFCGGQSNMEMPLWTGNPFWRNIGGDAIIAGDYPGIRLYNGSSYFKKVSPGVICVEPRGSGWQRCTPETLKGFSATAFFFGLQLNKELNVPVGLIESCWSGTNIEPWISKTAYEAAGRTKELNAIAMANASREQIDSKRAAIQAKFESDIKKWNVRFENFNPAATAAAKTWSEKNYDDSKWQATQNEKSLFKKAGLGVIWLRRYVEIPADWAGKELKLKLGAIDDCDEVWFDGVKVGSTGVDTPKYWQAARVYDVPGKMVKPGRSVIAARISNISFDGGMTAPDKKLETSDGAASISLDNDWREKLEYTADAAKLGPIPVKTSIDIDSSHFPATLYNSMVAPWGRYPIRGFIWYQGCSNAGNPNDYKILQPMLVQDWRRNWQDQDLPFILTQLSGMLRNHPETPDAPDAWKRPEPQDRNWGYIREAQADIIGKVPTVGMAVALDKGDMNDIHPHDKAPIGFRLAKEAMRLAYGSKETTSGPRYKSVEFKDGKAVISFTNIGSGLEARETSGGKLNCFAVAGDDGRFVWADAVIDGDKVVVSSSQVTAPKHVRYGWVDYFGELNFYNREGFPAEPFRTGK